MSKKRWWYMLNKQHTKKHRRVGNELDMLILLMRSLLMNEKQTLKPRQILKFAKSMAFPSSSRFLNCPAT